MENAVGKNLSLRNISVIAAIFVTLVASLHIAAAQTQSSTPLSVSAFIHANMGNLNYGVHLAEESRTVSSANLPPPTRKVPELRLDSPEQNVAEVEVEGYVQDIYLCPPCPAHAKCKPCGNFMVLSDSARACLKPGENNPLACPDTLFVSFGSSRDYSDIAKGDKIRIKVETHISASVIKIFPHNKTKTDFYENLRNSILKKYPASETASPSELIPGKAEIKGITIKQGNTP